MVEAIRESSARLRRFRRNSREVFLMISLTPFHGLLFHKYKRSVFVCNLFTVSYLLFLFHKYKKHVYVKKHFLVYTVVECILAFFFLYFLTKRGFIIRSLHPWPLLMLYKTVCWAALIIFTRLTCQAYYLWILTFPRYEALYIETKAKSYNFWYVCQDLMNPEWVH